MSFRYPVVNFLYGPLGFGQVDIVIKSGTGPGGIIRSWDASLGPQITQQQHDDALNDLITVNGQTFSQWQAENGGDPTLTNRRRSKDEGIDGDTALSVAQRAELGERNKRDNYLVTRIIELQNALLTLQASAGNAGARLDALPSSYSPTATRARADARQDLRDEIDSGGSDT